MKVSEMSPEQRREYNKIQKREQRSRKKKKLAVVNQRLG